MEIVGPPITALRQGSKGITAVGCELHEDGPDVTRSTKQLGPKRKGDQEGLGVLTTSISVRCWTVAQPHDLRRFSAASN